jgi:hypothetical protein
VHPRARVAGYVAAAVLVAAGTLWATGGLDPADAPVRAKPGQPLTHKSGRVTHTIPVLVADVILPVLQ